MQLVVFLRPIESVHCFLKSVSILSLVQELWLWLMMLCLFYREQPPLVS